jgi:hypothetical protein
MDEKTRQASMCGGGGGTATHTQQHKRTTSISNYCFLLDLRVRGNNKGTGEKIKPTAPPGEIW